MRSSRYCITTLPLIALALIACPTQAASSHPARRADDAGLLLSSPEIR